MKAILVFAGLSALCLQAQPKFDVVSIKPCKPGVAGGGDSSPGRLSLGCAILAGTDNTGLIQQAYNRYAQGHLTSWRIIPIEGAPDWIHNEAYQIDAKSEGQPDIITMLGPMMQKILEDRFKLKIHRETRQQPVYELALGKAAAKLKPLPRGSCVPVVVGQPRPPLAVDQHICRNMVGPRAVDFEGGTLSMLAASLSLVVDRPVVDKTGIPDYFEIHLTFSPDETPDAPNIFQAIQELGLKLSPAKGPLDVLVIDHVEKPSAN